MRRRRGAELEAAILDAAWRELRESGYANFTVEAVARRAGTSTPVLYRRWAGRRELLEAAIARVSAAGDVEVPDTGSLRGDLHAIMTAANATRVDLLAAMMVLLGGYFDEVDSSPALLREQILGRRSAADLIFRRAAARGEVDERRLTPRVVSLPFDLYRHEVLTTLQPVAEDVVDQILDQVVLPLTERPPGDESGGGRSPG